LWTAVRGRWPERSIIPPIRLTNASGVKFYWAQMPARVFRSLNGETVAGSRQSSGGVKTSVEPSAGAFVKFAFSHLRCINVAGPSYKHHRWHRSLAGGLCGDGRESP
jgi:hypothetical protein